MTRLLAEHCHLKGHLFKMGLVHSPRCDGCKQASEMASHVLCGCEALGVFRFRGLGHHSWNQVTLLTSPSAGYCTLFEVQGVTAGPTLLYCTVL